MDIRVTLAPNPPARWRWLHPSERAFPDAARQAQAAAMSGVAAGQNGTSSQPGEDPAAHRVMGEVPLEALGELWWRIQLADGGRGDRRAGLPGCPRRSPGRPYGVGRGPGCRHYRNRHFYFWPARSAETWQYSASQQRKAAQPLEE
jgi:hypothetical protein